jgi:glycosyltransferase involved in cell wall biosynthesis
MSQKQKISILVFHHSLIYGGAERTTSNLVSGLNPDRFEVYFLSQPEIWNSLRDNMAHFTYIPAHTNTWFGSFKDIKRDISFVGRVLKDRKPELALGVMPYAAFLLVAAKKLFRLKTKIIVSSRAPLSRVLTFVRKAWNLKSTGVLSLKFKFMLYCRFADAFISASKGSLEEHIRDFHVRRQMAFVIPNGIDLDKVSRLVKEPAELPFANELPVIAWVGRISPEKRLDFIFDAFSQIVKEIPSRLMILGEGEYRSELELLARQLGIENFIYFAGFKENIYPYLARSDIFVHACHHEEFGYTLIEAMASGLPVISQDCPYGPGEILDGGKYGILISDTGSMAQAIKKLLSDSQIRKDLSQKSLLRVKNYSLDKIIALYEETFTKVCQDENF